MLKQGLNQKMLQKLSPQQIQLMKLLQVPTATLDQRIKEELEANPALDEGADISEEEKIQEDDFEATESTEDNDVDLDDYINEYIEEDPQSYIYSTGREYQEENEKQVLVAVENTFHDYLERQIGMLQLNGSKERAIALQVIGSIDDDGYLRRATDAIVDDLMFSQNVDTTVDEIEKILVKIQRLDPPGIGARNLQESLVIQLENMAQKYDRPPLSICHARTILSKYFDEFTKKHYSKLMRVLELDEDDLRDAIDEILKLNPKPASSYSSQRSKSQQYVIPDFLITNNDGEIELELNSKNAPELRVNSEYRYMLDAYRTNKKQGKTTRQDKEAVLFIKQKIDSAKWFIDAIRKRQQTMYKTMYAILQFQYDYFVTGDQRKLRPMILKDISELTGLDVSTVSRVANSKYVQTEFGTKKLKDFFSESLQNSKGEEVSTLEVKKILEEIIGAENKQKPLSDEKIKAHLKEKGYEIARRTIAKYREQLNIPVARLRKEL